MRRERGKTDRGRDRERYRDRRERDSEGQRDGKGAFETERGRYLQIT